MCLDFCVDGRLAAVEAFLIRQISRSRLLDSWLTELDSGVRSRETYRQRRTCAFGHPIIQRSDQAPFAESTETTLRRADLAKQMRKSNNLSPGNVTKFSAQFGESS